jgi:small conductance mechanosensitive channel
VFFFPVLAFAQQHPASQVNVDVDQTPTLKKVSDWVAEVLVKYSLQVFAGIIVLVLGWMVAQYLAKFLRDFLHSKHVDITISKFLVNAFRLLVMGFALLIALGKFGIEIAPFIAGFSVIGFATSFALQGPLSNYAAGVTLIFTKPFKVGDIIEVIGMIGQVEDLNLSQTVLRTIDNTVIVIPNRHIIGEVVQNYSGCKKLDINVGVRYDTDIDKAVKVMCEVVHNDPRVVSSPNPKIGISQFGEFSINLYGRLWVKQADYWDVMFCINKGIVVAFRKNGIIIPIPQRDVHLFEPKT